MPIQVLPPQLANQIAAGEVVERPASVVKELVENSLDAGATRIDIDIERGGAKLIRIRDNGCGIKKDELALALARHATSKIASLDDLEAIISLGFRGEALASISSVSRLTLTSRTAEQQEAWQAYAEGRDMNVTVKPAAHPVGTTLEVLDLFYNTPARRKFLRTEKTEFNHIDEIIRRIALARFDVTINLSHNGKIVRQYRAVPEGGQKERRCSVAEIESDRLHCAKRLVQRYGGVAVLKGAGTVVAAHPDALGIIDAGNAGMASGGMGDVLSGIIGALLGQKLSPYDAACAGCVAHGAAADVLAARFGTRGMLATDLFSTLQRIVNPEVTDKNHDESSNSAP